MHAILMTSASHLQRLYPESYEDYKILSTKHLNYSLRSFRNTLSSRTYVANNFEAVLATTFLFLMHACSNPIFDPKNPTIDPLLQHCSGLYDIIRYHPCQAPYSIFQPICMPMLLPAALPDSGPGRCLIDMVKSNTMDRGLPDPNTKLYIGTVKSLAPIIDVVISQPPFGGAPPDALLLYFIRWLSFLPPDFLGLVNSYHAKALIIMAHYYAVVAFVLSNWKQGWWFLRERPAYMINNIAAYVGEDWAVWMSWPVSVLKFCRLNGNTPGYSTLLRNAHFEGISGIEEPEMGVLSAVELHFNKVPAEG